MTTTRNNEHLNQTVSQMLHAAQHVMIVSHVRPDGDAIGGLLGLGLSLQQTGKTVHMVLADGVPSSFRHLDGSAQIIRQPKGMYDLKIVLDCSDLLRTGLTWETPPDLNIDHHVTNLDFARVNFVQPEAEATCSILAAQMETWGLPISQPVAKALLTGIVSDTLGFRTSSTSPQALRLSANLMEKGANLADLYNRALIRRSFEAARFWGLGLDQLQRQDGLVWTTLRLEDRVKVNYPGNDDADLVNFLASIDESSVVIIFVEQKEGNVKVSWRAQPGWDVSKVALHFGGGGHPGAAGAMISGSLEQVQQQVLSATSSLLERGPETA